MYHLLMNSNWGYLLQILPFLLLIGALYLIFRIRFLKRNTRPISVWNEAVRLLMVCYLAGLLALVWTPANFWSSLWFYLLHGYSGGSIGQLFTGSYHFTPSLLLVLTGEISWGGWSWFMALGNLLLYLPFGLLLPLLWKGLRCRWVLLAGFLLSAITELGQPVFGRSFDLDDLLANTLGVLAGFFLYSLIRRLAPQVVLRIQEPQIPV